MSRRGSTISMLEEHPNLTEILGVLAQLAHIRDADLPRLAEAWNNTVAVPEARDRALSPDSPLVLEALAAFEALGALFDDDIRGEAAYVTIASDVTSTALKAVRDAIAASYAKPILSRAEYAALMRAWRVVYPEATVDEPDLTVDVPGTPLRAVVADGAVWGTAFRGQQLLRARAALRVLCPGCPGRRASCPDIRARPKWRRSRARSASRSAPTCSPGRLCCARPTGWTRASRPDLAKKAASVSDYRDLAKARLPHFLFEYIDGGSYDEVTLRRNVAETVVPIFTSAKASRQKCASTATSRRFVTSRSRAKRRSRC